VISPTTSDASNLNVMLSRMGTGKTDLSREPCNVHRGPAHSTDFCVI